MSTNGNGNVLGPGGGPSFNVLGDQITCKASAEQTNDAWEAFE